MSVKLTLIGRPGTVQKQPASVGFTLNSATHQIPPPPKGLPLLKGTTKYLVLAATKHWDKVEAALSKDKEDKALYRGLPDQSGGLCRHRRAGHHPEHAGHDARSQRAAAHTGPGWARLSLERSLGHLTLGASVGAAHQGLRQSTLLSSQSSVSALMFVGLHLTQISNRLLVKRLARWVVDARHDHGEQPERLALRDRRSGQIAQHLADGGMGDGIVMACYSGLVGSNHARDPFLAHPLPSLRRRKRPMAW